MKRLLLSFVAMIIGAISLFAEERVVTITATDALWGTTAGAQSGTKDGVTITGGRGMLSAATSSGHYRAYADYVFSVSVAEGNITSIMLTCTAPGTNNYGPSGFANCSVGKYSYNENIGLWTGNAGTVEFPVTKQGRMTQIKVTYEVGAPAPEATALELQETGIINTEYYAGDAFSTEGLAAIATFADESTQDVTSAATWTCEPATIAEDTKSVTVTATYKDLTARKSYDITVKSIANTAETAYTVEEAVALIDANKGLNAEVYVKGIVSSVAKFNNSYGQIDYYISSDGTEEAQQFECYNGLNIGGAKFTSIDEIEVGAEIVAKGQLTKYGSTYELARGNELVSYKMATKALTSLAIAGTPAKLSYSAGEAPSADGLTVEATFDDGSTQNVTGKVVWTFTPETITENCTVTAIATYQEVSAITTFDVTVRTITGISISGTPQTVYQVGANPSADGLTVEATFSDETTQDVTADVTWTFDPETIAEGTTQVTATAEYEGFTASTTFDVAVSAASQMVFDKTKGAFDKLSLYSSKNTTMYDVVLVDINGVEHAGYKTNGGYTAKTNGCLQMAKTNGKLTSPEFPDFASGYTVKVIYYTGGSNPATLKSGELSATGGADGTTKNQADGTGFSVELSVPTGAAFELTAGNAIYVSYIELTPNVVSVTPVSVTISNAGYATLCLPYAGIIPAGVKAYAAKDNGNTVTLTERTDGVIAAEEGVVLQGAAGTYTFDPYKDGAVEKMSGNEMVGVTEATPLSTANGVYLLSRNKTTNKTAFRLLETDYTLGANKAYLKPASVSYSRLMIDIDDNVETGIDAVNGQEDASRPKVIYNLAGQRMSRTTKGINIVNGKLVLQ